MVLEATYGVIVDRSNDCLNENVGLLTHYREFGVQLLNDYGFVIHYWMPERDYDIEDPFILKIPPTVPFFNRSFKVIWNKISDFSKTTGIRIVKFYVSEGKEFIITLFCWSQLSWERTSPPVKALQFLVEHPILLLFSVSIKLVAFKMEGK